VQKYGEKMKLPNFWAKKFKESIFFYKKREEKGDFFGERCNFAAAIKR